MAKTSIEWATDVWNPVTGCTKVSAGCKFCYAETIANRFWGERKFTDVRLHPERLEQIQHWRKPRRVFVNSMSDLFHEDVPNHFIAKVLQFIGGAKQHTFMVLTKRPRRMNDLLGEAVNLPKNLWLGVSVENQAAADERIPLLLQTPAAVRFVSCEPLLGPVDLWRFGDPEIGFATQYDHRGTYPFYQVLGWENKPIQVNHGLDWVIVGGESGPNARPMHPEWARSLRDQCQAAGVPYFFKQWGEWLWVHPDRKAYEYSSPPPKTTEIGDMRFYRFGKKAAGRLLDGREWNEYPEGE